MLKDRSSTSRSARRARALSTSPLALLVAGTAVGLISCSDDRVSAPPLLGVSPLLPAGTGEMEAVAPTLVEAESATLGADVTTGEDTEASVTFVTATVDVADPPADLTDPRISELEVTFPEAGEYQVYARFRIGPGGGTDDSFYLNVGSEEEPNWVNLNSLSGYTVAGQDGYQPGIIVGNSGANSTPSVWKWGLMANVSFVVTEDALTQTIRFATREDGLDLDKFAFAQMGDGYTTGYTVDQLDAGEAGVVVLPPVLPPPFTPPATQAPLADGLGKFLGSVCCGVQRQSLENYFNQVTPENAGKWGSVEAVRDEYVWDGLDEALQVAEDNGFPFRYHVLLWGSQQPDWIATLPPEEQLEEIQEWMNAVAERYAGRLDYIEVANEFENQPPNDENQGNYVEALGGAGETGYDWVLTGFRMAREAFGPDAVLMLNEYSVINTDDRTTRYIELVELLQQENLINAIGVQGHAFSTTGDVAQMVANIDRLGATGLPVIITEMDVDGPPMEQLIDFHRMFPAFWENDNIAGITLWGYRVGHWRTDQDAPLVYENGAEKPALRWLKGYLRQTAPTVAGPATATVAAGAEVGAEIATFTATGPGGAAIPDGAEVQWGVAGGDAAALGSVAFAPGTGRLEVTNPELAAGTYQIDIFTDVDATVSNLFTVELTVE